MSAKTPSCPYKRLGPALPTLPVVIAVPHAGRDYPSALLRDAVVSRDRLEQLEDRYADRLIEGALAAGATAIVAQYARAWIDLNRDPRDIDPTMMDGTPPPNLMTSARARGGLGLIPHRLGYGGELWRRKLGADEIAQRVIQFHKPYHDSIAIALASAHARFGVAILLDCHSMPPLRGRSDVSHPKLIVGDRFGKSASSTFTDRIEAVARDHGLSAARNAPYAGGYSVEFHGRPRRGIHAIQIELDRGLYLKPGFAEPSAGLAPTTAIVSALFMALVEEALAHPLAIAAE